MTDNSDTSPPEHTILWRRIDLPGHDACGLRRTQNGWRLHGTALFSLDGSPCQLEYYAECDRAWRARSAGVTGWIGRENLHLEIIAHADGRWDLNGAEQTAVAGCIDVDLNFTPATNLIAIRRLALSVGEQTDAPAAWLRFPELQLERLEQRYHRIAVDEYDYAAPDVGYAGILQVVPVGFVTCYPGLWELETVR